MERSVDQDAIEALKVKTEAELQECLAVRREVFIEEQAVPEELEIDEWDVIGGAQHLLVRQGGRAVACGRLRRYDERTAKLQRIAVRQEGRGQGLGRHVVLGLEALAREAGYTAAALDAQKHAEGFYKRLGYQTVSAETFLDAGIPHVKMKKEL